MRSLLPVEYTIFKHYRLLMKLQRVVALLLTMAVYGLILCLRERYAERWDHPPAILSTFLFGAIILRAQELWDGPNRRMRTNSPLAFIAPMWPLLKALGNVTETPQDTELFEQLDARSRTLTRDIGMPVLQSYTLAAVYRRGISRRTGEDGDVEQFLAASIIPGLLTYTTSLKNGDSPNSTGTATFADAVILFVAAAGGLWFGTRGSGSPKIAWVISAIVYYCFAQSSPSTCYIWCAYLAAHCLGFYSIGFLRNFQGKHFDIFYGFLMSAPTSEERQNRFRKLAEAHYQPTGMPAVRNHRMHSLRQIAELGKIRDYAVEAASAVLLPFLLGGVAFLQSVNPLTSFDQCCLLIAAICSLLTAWLCPWMYLIGLWFQEYGMAVAYDQVVHQYFDADPGLVLVDAISTAQLPHDVLHRLGSFIPPRSIDVSQATDEQRLRYSAR